MASSKEYVKYITEQCKELSARAMMGDYVLYCGGKVIGGIYDNRLLVKPTPSAVAMLPDAKKELPYEGAKEMLFVEETDDGDLLSRLFEAISRELPEPKKRK